MSSMQENLDKEFADFIALCKKQKLSKNEIKKIFKPIYWKFYSGLLKRVLLGVFSCYSLFWLYNNVDIISWSVSAIGRIIMIQILPIWDWTTLYDAKCLVEHTRNEPTTSVQDPQEGKFETGRSNCILCERLDHIDSLENIKFSFIQQKYLEKGLPVIVAQSHTPETFLNFLNQMKLAADYVESDPCDVETNLMLQKLINIDELLENVLDEQENDSWFFHLRNCQFKAIKASRSFVKKPYYYPPHLEPFYSSWILASKDFTVFNKDLYLDGLVIVQQLVGQLLVTLAAKEPCEEVCGQHEILLNEGEALVFTTDLWIFEYSLDKFGESVTTIMETNWN